MKIAIPVWEERISPVFDAATRLIIVEIESDKEIGRFEITIDIDAELYDRFKFIDELNIDCIICGAISRLFLERLNGLGIKVIYGVSGKANNAISAYLNGRPFDFLIPGYNIPKGGCKKKWKNKRQLRMRGSCRKRK